MSSEGDRVLESPRIAHGGRHAVCSAHRQSRDTHETQAGVRAVCVDHAMKWGGVWVDPSGWVRSSEVCDCAAALGALGALGALVKA
jgi:hypothetical protein